MFKGLGLDMLVASPILRAIVPGQSAMPTNDPNDQSRVYIDKKELLRNLKRKVLDAQKCMCPLEGRYAFLFGYGIGHQGVIVTLDDDETKYLIHKLPLDMSKGTGAAIVAYASNMGRTWRRGEHKKIHSSTFNDYLDACGNGYALHSDDCRHAAQRMWALS